MGICDAVCVKGETCSNITVNSYSNLISDDFSLYHTKEHLSVSIPVKCLTGLSGLFSPNLIDQSLCKMALVWPESWMMIGQLG